MFHQGKAVQLKYLHTQTVYQVLIKSVAFKKQIKMGMRFKCTHIFKQSIWLPFSLLQLRAADSKLKQQKNGNSSKYFFFYIYNNNHQTACLRSKQLSTCKSIVSKQAADRPIKRAQGTNIMRTIQIWNRVLRLQMANTMKNTFKIKLTQLS